MTTTAAIRVLTPCRSADTDLVNTLVSLSAQDIGPSRLEVALLRRGPDPVLAGDVRTLCSALGLKSVEEVDVSALSAAQALNAGAQGGRAATLALAPEGSRLGRRFLSRCLEAMASTGAVAAFSGHTAGYADLRAHIRRRPFRPERLTRVNAVGPAALVRRASWRRLGGLRLGLRFYFWDFWLRLVMAGGAIAEVPELLATCPPVERLSPRRDGQAKAMLVVCTPGAFEPDVCRWAMALLRGDPWAEPFAPGHIPGPRDVAGMFVGRAFVPRPRLAACE